MFRSGSASDRGDTREGDSTSCFNPSGHFNTAPPCSTLRLSHIVRVLTNCLFVLNTILVLLLSSSEPRGALCNHVDGREAVDSCTAKDIHQMVCWQNSCKYNRLIIMFRLNNKLKVRNLAISDLTQDLSDGVSSYLITSQTSTEVWHRST